MSENPVNCFECMYMLGTPSSYLRRNSKNNTPFMFCNLSHKNIANIEIMGRHTPEWCTIKNGEEPMCKVCEKRKTHGRWAVCKVCHDALYVDRAGSAGRCEVRDKEEYDR